MTRSIALLSVVAAVLLAQSNRGGISGTVLDSSGAVVPHAAITITNVGTNQTLALKASDAGAYAMQNLDPVVYRIAAQAPGFKKAVVENVKVDTARVAEVNVTLETGATSAEITVSAAAPVVNAESGTIGQTITEKQMDGLPLLNRNVLDLAITVPGVTGDPQSEEPPLTSGATVPGFNLNLNGGRSGSTMMMADGVNNTGVGLGRAIVTFSPETVQEFTVQTSSYSAEYGSTGGGIVNVTTKSGTNQYHGIGLWYSRNPSIDAAPWTNQSFNRPSATLRDNEFSISAGGPVIVPKLYNGRNRTFFFGAIEPRRRTDQLQEDALLPSAAMRQGDFSDAVLVPGNGNQGNDPIAVPASVAQQFGIVSSGPATLYQQFAPVGNQLQILPAPSTGQTYAAFPGNQIPANLLDSTSQKLLQYVPRPGPYYVDSGGYLVNYTLLRFVHSDNTRYLAKLDQVLSDKNHLTFRATIVPIVAVTGYGSPVNGNGGTYSYSRQFLVGDTHIFSPTTLNDLRLNYTRGRFSGTFSPQYDIKTGQNLSTEYGLPSLTAGGLPLFQTGLGTFGNIGSEGSTLNDNKEERYNAADTLFINKGKMRWAIGGQISKSILNEVSFFSAAGGDYFFRSLQTNATGTAGGAGGSSFASFLLGAPNNVTLADAVLPYYYHWWDGAAFVQNDWKVKPNLTLNLGLRYSLQFPRTEKYNHQGTFLPQLAQSYPLPQPMTLANGQTIASALIPPFGFDGMGGRAANLWPTRWNDFEPRFGFAWSPHFRGIDKWVVRGGYGLSHAPLTGQARLPAPSFNTPATAFTETSGAVNPNYAMRLASNPPNDPALSWTQVLGPVPPNGLVTLSSINYLAASSGTAFALAQDIKTPYVQNWNLSVQRQLGPRTVIEAAYVGSKGTHLFLPHINDNPSNLSLIEALFASNTSVTATVNDPLGRIGSNGKVIMVQQGSLGSEYPGFNNLYTYYDTAANSIYHAGFVSVIHRPAKGLFLTASYTRSKSIDDASDASPDKNTLITESLGGQVTFGGTLAGDRSVSTFDVPNRFVTAFLYDLPVGRGQRFLNSMPRLIDGALGGWSVGGIEAVQTGFPFLVTLSDTNLLGDTTQTHTIRPDIVPGVPLVNPLYQTNCPTSNQCEPYLNPAAFMRPAVGQLGDAPRTIPWVRGPLQQTLDLTVQKNVFIREKVRVQFRFDALNALNHPVWAFTPNSTASDFIAAPSSTNAITQAQFNAWATYNNQPVAASASDPRLVAAQNVVNLNKNPAGVLPADFYSVPIPQGFALKNANSFDITTPGGYKLWALRNQYTATFGDLYNRVGARVIQFGLKIYF